MMREIVGADMARRAYDVVSELEKKVKAGTATEAEQQRYRDGRDMLLIYEWKAKPVAPAELMPPLPRNPRPTEVVLFADWWERVRTREKWRGVWWLVALDEWIRPRFPDEADPAARFMALACCELKDRGLLEEWPAAAKGEAA